MNDPTEWTIADVMAAFRAGFEFAQRKALPVTEMDGLAYIEWPTDTEFGAELEKYIRTSQGG